MSELSKPVTRFICKRIPGSAPFEILQELTQLVRETFHDLVSLSFRVVEDPELADEDRLCLEIITRGSVDDVSAQYDRYICSLIEKFPFETRRWFVTDINLV
jgi:hypothetical protein